MSSGQALTTSRMLLILKSSVSNGHGTGKHSTAIHGVRSGPRALVWFRHELLSRALASTGGNMCAAARMLGIHRNTATRWQEMA